jgi:uncharacterized protein YqgV (UPF0045/DUF77 family)
MNLKTTDKIIGIDIPIQNKEISEIKRYLKKYGNTYTLEPHITLLLLPVSNFSDELFDELKSFLFKINLKEIKVLNLDLNKGRKFLSLKIDERFLKELHMKLLKIVQKYNLKAVRKKDFEKMKNNLLDKKELEYLEKYGYYRVLDNFDIHITLGNVTCETCLDDVFQELKEKTRSLNNKKINVEQIKLLFHTDAEKQSGMKILKKEMIKLKN